jgi:hypothetical protein
MKKLYVAVISLLKLTRKNTRHGTTKDLVYSILDVMKKLSIVSIKLLKLTRHMMRHGTIKVVL